MPEPDHEAGTTALVELGAALRAGGYKFTTITPASHAIVNARPSNALARNMTDVFGWSRPFRGGVLPDPIVSLMQRADVLEEAPGGFRSRVRVSTLRDMLFFHSAFPTEARDAVFFGPDTYKFADAIRLHLAERHTAPSRAVDVFSGAGPGGLVIAQQTPGVAVQLADINDNALRLARVNTRLAGAADVVARHSNLLDGVDGDFDLVVGHPPYLVDRSERAYRHGGGSLGSGLALALIEAALPRLRPGGSLLLFTGVVVVDGDDPFRDSAAATLAKAGFSWSYREVDPDVFGEELTRAPYDASDRIALVALTAVRPA